MKTSATDDSVKPSQSKSTKKSAKSRSKPAKNVQSSSNSLKVNTTATSPTSVLSSSSVGVTSTTPTSSLTNNVFDSTPAASIGIGVNSTPSDMSSSGGSSSGSKSHQKNYGGFESRSIKVIWEQYDQSDIELSEDVCTRLAEDVSYKVWELINNIKIYARHSGGKITYDLVNEVLRDADVPPALGALDNSWDCIDYDGSYYFYSDKIIELRDEYQKEIRIEMPLGDDFIRSWILEDRQVEIMRKYIPSLVYVTLHGSNTSFEAALQKAAFSPLISVSYRVVLTKIIEVLAYKQSDGISLRCWKLLRACAVNPYVQDVDCRKEHFHLAEILICQLIGPLECIKIRSEDVLDDSQKSEANIEIKIENSSGMKNEAMQTETPNSDILYNDTEELQQQQQQNKETQEALPDQALLAGESIFRLQPEEDGTNDAYVYLNASTSSKNPAVSIQFSPYFATPVDLKNVEELCWTLGMLSGMSGYFQSECIFLINKRLDRFFMGRQISTKKEYNYIGRALRGMIALGEFAFREFIPFILKFDADGIPENLWNDIALSATFLKGSDDIFLYEWLEYVCGEKLQAFMAYHAEYLEKLHTTRFLRRRQSTFRINPKVGARRLEWSTLAAAMCHGDDPNRALRPKPKMYDAFPNLVEPNLNINRAGNIRFKFAGCRPTVKPKKKTKTVETESASSYFDAHKNSPSDNVFAHHDIIIAKRKLFKPLTNERRIVPLSSYFYARI